jgi:hypothetical protein
MPLFGKIFQTKKVCPHCGSKTVDALRREGIIDTVLGILRFRPCHCRRCYAKFYLADSKKKPSPTAPPRRNRR